METTIWGLEWRLVITKSPPSKGLHDLFSQGRGLGYPGLPGCTPKSLKNPQVVPVKVFPNMAPK